MCKFANLVLSFLKGRRVGLEPGLTRNGKAATYESCDIVQTRSKIPNDVLDLDDIECAVHSSKSIAGANLSLLSYYPAYGTFTAFPPTKRPMTRCQLSSHNKSENSPKMA